MLEVEENTTDLRKYLRLEYELVQCTCTVFQLMANQSSYMDPMKKIFY